MARRKAAGSPRARPLRRSSYPPLRLLRGRGTGSDRGGSVLHRRGIAMLQLGIAMLQFGASAPQLGIATLQLGIAALELRATILGRRVILGRRRVSLRRRCAIRRCGCGTRRAVHSTRRRGSGTGSRRDLTRRGRVLLFDSSGVARRVPSLRRFVNRAPQRFRNVLIQASELLRRAACAINLAAG